MSSSALPPMGNLPSWSRVSSLDRSRYPKPFLRDRLQTLPPTGGNHGSSTDVDKGSVSMGIQLVDNLSAAEQKRFLYYDNSIKFLQQEHADTLKKLHEEIELLKQQNKDLQFKLIMGQIAEPHSDQKSPTTLVSEGEVSQSNSNLHNMLLHEEIKDLRHALKNAHNQNLVLQHALHLQNKRKDSSVTKNSNSITPSDSLFSPEDFTSSHHSSALQDPTLHSTQQKEQPLPFGTTLNPLRIRGNSNVDARSPSLEECEVIINYLHRLSARQAEENNLLNTHLQSLLFPKRSRSAHKLDTDEKTDEIVVLPKVSLRENLPESKPRVGSSSERVSLPALKQTINTNVAERKKRQQAVQKARVKRDYQHHF